MNTDPTFEITQEIINECLEAALEDVNINKPNAVDTKNIFNISK